jgi:hypothetical protein
LVHTSRTKRLVLVFSTTAWTLSFGYVSLLNLSRLSIARVRWEMDAWVLVPIAINIGYALGSGLALKVERKQVERAARAEAAVEGASGGEERLSVQEFLAEDVKRPLLDV